MFFTFPTEQDVTITTQIPVIEQKANWECIIADFFLQRVDDSYFSENLCKCPSLGPKCFKNILRDF